jgi:cytidylate kinase
MIITIDGPARSGKGTVARALAKKLNYYYLETGLLYRAVAYIALYILGRSGDELEHFTPEECELFKEIVYTYEEGEPRIYYKGEALTNVHLREMKGISQAASRVSASPCVRDALIAVQRDVAEKFDVVADGRDCGSVVFPNADRKFFLTASLDERARRETRESHVSFEEACAVLAQRDKRDMERAVAPLIQPKDAVLIDNTNLDAHGTLARMLEFL